MFGSFRLLYHHIFKWLWNEKVFWNIQIENLLTSFYCLSKLLGWSINEQVTVSKGYDFSYCGSNMAHIYIYISNIYLHFRIMTALYNFNLPSTFLKFAVSITPLRRSLKNSPTPSKCHSKCLPSCKLSYTFSLRLTAFIETASTSTKIRVSSMS